VLFAEAGCPRALFLSLYNFVKAQTLMSNKSLQATAAGPFRSEGLGCITFPFRSVIAAAAVPELGRSAERKEQMP